MEWKLSGRFEGMGMKACGVDMMAGFVGLFYF